MATAIAHRAECVRNSNIFRLSFNFFRNLSSASSSPSSASQNPSASNKSKRRKKKNLFEVAQFLPNWGIGYHMAKAHWAEVSYEITKINLYKDGKHGKAWGIVHKNGVRAAEAPRKISGVHKRCWRYIANIKSQESSPNITNSTTDSDLKVETQAN